MTKNLRNAAVWLGLVVLLSWLAVAAGCQSLSSAQLPIQFATVKYIEETGTPAQAVIDHVERARQLLERDTTVSAQGLAEEVLGAVDTGQLTASEKLLLTALIASAQDSIRQTNLIEPDTRLSILLVLGWIEQAARMAL
jgi:hypothetical protein